METARCKAFLYAAETGTITQAADKLAYTPSGVSQLIQALENELGVQLLFRNKRGVTLTEEGALFLPVVREFLRQEDAIYQLSSEVHGLAVGSVTIATYSSIAAHWLPQVIHRFQEDYPNIRIQLIEGYRQEVESLLSEKKADLAFMSYKEPMPYEWIPLAEDPLLAILNRSHPCAGKSSYPLTNISSEKAVIIPAQGFDADTRPLLEEYGLSHDLSFKTGETPPAIAMVEQDIGICIINKLITDKLDFDVIKMPVDPPQSITLGIAMNSLKSASPAVRKFVDVAVKMLSKPE